jgi:hypothetical protein
MPLVQEFAVFQIPANRLGLIDGDLEPSRGHDGVDRGTDDEGAREARGHTLIRRKLETRFHEMLAKINIDELHYSTTVVLYRHRG